MQWILAETEQPPESFIQAVKQYTPLSSGSFAAQLLWQRGIKDPETLAAFVNFQAYQPASPFEFGREMDLAIQRLKKAATFGEKVSIWGDFDADGITSTAVLWDGLGQFFLQHQQLIYYIPNRLKESHGLNLAGIDNLAQQGCTLIVTCDTGSTNIDEIIYAQKLGIDVIITDHHTLPVQRPPVVAIINPRYLPKEHSLFHLSGVAVAYKLVEALYETLPDVPENPLTDLLDLVAVGLIADLVQLSGDCRYLAQLGIQQLQADYKKPVAERRRPGVGRLLELCQRSGDRPTDISFGLGPRINAVSRIHGDASFCVELLTSRDIQRCHQLAEETELANTRRKSLQKDVQNQVLQKLSQLDLSTTSVIVLEDPQWASGVLGLVAGQVAQETGRPTILLSTESGDSEPKLARGSARSINSVDLYQLVKEQAHLLHRFGGHPFAAGLSLLVENIPLFTDAINQKLRQSLGGINLVPTVQADLVVTVADLGKDLFLELKLLEPCGMGNPVPKLLIKNCWFENAWHRNQEDLKGKKIQYIKTEFNIRDDSTNNPFPGIWWGHYKEELPIGRCDCIAEIDYNSFKKRYEIRLIAVRLCAESEFKTQNSAVILDWRNQDYSELSQKKEILIIADCPRSWDELKAWLRRSLYSQQQLVLAWSKTQQIMPKDIWLMLVGIAKYLHRTNEQVSRVQLLNKLGISDQSLHLGFQALKYLGFTVQYQDRYFQISWDAVIRNEIKADNAITKFLAAVQEEQFQQEYFTTVPVAMIQAIAVNGVQNM
ncbi:single-stranded-DNA-specific exonuclease RecJ [Sphaerospermopsis aphanizomenoides BCCUSP55]|uniref:single-stranded-DNA-specific exonuclease RecJ n=1 Tax=Sphaerospermopsis aphanizomenoides TaxID=459663 RepID=UPI001903E09E|nr:single-stranded-DNA-specific exonuclease RecJ [Sphaerospermopsis aphanizomenoides]MBK1990300.1 single-stranded-DNA-specific exonuclease RecJ [Sphaerospermopsis aphanizomenoides BCCUSP55]